MASSNVVNSTVTELILFILMVSIMYAAIGFEDRTVPPIRPPDDPPDLVLSQMGELFGFWGEGYIPYPVFVDSVENQNLFPVPSDSAGLDSSDTSPNEAPGYRPCFQSDSENPDPQFAATVTMDRQVVINPLDMEATAVVSGREENQWSSIRLQYDPFRSQSLSGFIDLDRWAEEVSKLTQGESRVFKTPCALYAEMRLDDNVGNLSNLVRNYSREDAEDYRRFISDVAGIIRSRTVAFSNSSEVGQWSNPLSYQR